MKRLLAISALIAIAMIPRTSAASVLLQEDFTYTSGSLLTASGNWAAHSGAGTNAIAVTNGGLTYSGYPGSGLGNAASMTTNGEDDHTLTPFTVNSGSIYVAFLANVSAAQTSGDYFFHFYQSSSLFYGRVFCKNAGAGVNFGITRGSGTANYSASSFAKSATHLLVVKYTFVGGTLNDTADLWVDPTIGAFEPAPLVSANDVGSTDAGNINAVALRQGASGNAPTQQVDGIRVGTTWSEVVAGLALGVCCAPDGSCTISSQADCAFDWHGELSTCDPNPCSPQLGACCAPDGICLLTPQASCLPPDLWHGDWPNCDPNPCPQPQGACCLASGACHLLTQAECIGNWLGAGTTCSPYPCPAQIVTLCQIQEDDSLGVPVRVGRKVELEGIAITNSGTWSPTIQEFQLTDGDCCVTVFGDTLNPVVQIGDEVRVVGTISNFNGKVEVTTPALSVTVLSHGNPVPSPPVISTFELSENGEQYESCLFQLHCASIVGGDPWPVDGQNANVIVDDGSGPVTLRVDKDTDIDGSPAPSAPFNAIGIGDQFDTSSPYDQGYQIKPRGLADLQLDCTVAAAPIPVPATVFSLVGPWPSPSKGNISFQLALPRAGSARVEVLDAAGRLVARLWNGPLDAGVHNLGWDGGRSGGARVSSGVYFLRVHTAEETRAVTFHVVR